jgi:Uma2 family endonuclease
MVVASPFLDVLERQRRITVGEYHRMIEAGILGENEHVQLLSGTLVAMTPQGRPHARVVQRLNRLLVRAIGDDLEVLTQLPLTLLDESEPEPDLAVVRAEDAQSGEHHPRTALLVVEVAGDSLRLDRQSKAALYAQAGIPEYWIANLAEATVEVHREPDPATGSYRARAVVPSGETLVAAAVRGLVIDVGALFR